jgi:hypothetical protein
VHRALGTCAYLNAAVLRRLWAMPWLPSQLGRARERKFPVLTEISSDSRRYGRAAGMRRPAWRASWSPRSRVNSHLHLMATVESGGSRA